MSEQKDVETLLFEDRGFISNVEFQNDYRQMGVHLIVRRHIRRIEERLDRAMDAPWVRWRRTMQGGHE